MGKPAGSIERPCGLLIWMPKNGGKLVSGSLGSARPRPKFGAKLKVKVVSKLPSWAKPKPRIWSPRNSPAPGDGKKSGESEAELADLLVQIPQVRVLTLIGVPTSADRVLEPKNPGGGHTGVGHGVERTGQSPQAKSPAPLGWPGASGSKKVLGPKKISKPSCCCGVNELSKLRIGFGGTSPQDEAGERLHIGIGDLAVASGRPGKATLNALKR